MNVLRCDGRRCVLNVGLLLLALSLPQVLLAQWKASVGAQSKDLGRQALAFLPNEIWTHEGDSVTWTFERAPGIPELRPAVDQQQRRAIPANNRVQTHIAGVDVATGECVGESGGEIWRARDGAGTGWRGQLGGRCAHEVLP